jgi:hypothetical protein
MRLVELGCTFHGAATLFAIDAPPGVDLDAVHAFLNSTGELWEQSDPELPGGFAELGLDVTV